MSDGTSAATPLVSRSDLTIPVGTNTVAATRYEPVNTSGPSPVVLTYAPYPKDDLLTYGSYDPINRYLARHNYEVVVADMVGTGASTGCFDRMFTMEEGEEGAEIVRWLADREWTTGDVGMVGKSYGGITALATAAQRPDPLSAIVPIHTPYTGYRNAYTHGGLFELNYIGMGWLTLMQALDAKPPGKHGKDERWREVWDQRLQTVRSRDPWLFQFLEHDRKDDYWSGTDIPVEKINTPTLAVGGWRDSYTRDTIEYAKAIDAPTRILLGPWRHQVPHRGRKSAIRFRDRVREWFDHFLLDRDTGALSGSEWVIWTGRGEEEGTWRNLSSWPTAGSDDPSSVFALTPKGLRSPRAFSNNDLERTYDIDYSVGISSFRPPDAPIPSRDTNADDVRSLSFDTGSLTQPVEYTGTGKATLRLRTEMADPTVSVRVVDVAPSGAATMVTQGTRRARLRTDCNSYRRIPTDKPFELDVPLEPTSHVFETGHRIRIAVAGAFFPETMATGSNGTLTLLSSPDSPSIIELPSSRWGTDRPLDELSTAQPDGTIPATSQWVRSADVSWETSRDYISDRTTLRRTTDFDIELPEAEMERKGRYEVSILSDDPDSVLADNELELSIKYPAETVTVVATNQFDRNNATVETRVTIDDQTVFEERWTR